MEAVERPWLPAMDWIRTGAEIIGYKKVADPWESFF